LVVYPGVNGGGEGLGSLPCWCCRGWGGLAALRRARGGAASGRGAGRLAGVRGGSPLPAG